MAYEYDGMFLVEEVVKERLAPRSHPAARRTSIDGFQRIRAMETEHAIEPSDRGPTQSRQSAEKGDERDEGDEQDAYEHLLVRLHRQLRLISLGLCSGGALMRYSKVTTVVVDEAVRGCYYYVCKYVFENKRRLAPA